MMGHEKSDTERAYELGCRMAIADESQRQAMRDYFSRAFCRSKDRNTCKTEFDRGFNETLHGSNQNA